MLSEPTVLVNSPKHMRARIIGWGNFEVDLDGSERAEGAIVVGQEKEYLFTKY